MENSSQFSYQRRTSNQVQLLLCSAIAEAETGSTLGEHAPFALGVITMSAELPKMVDGSSVRQHVAVIGGRNQPLGIVFIEVALKIGIQPTFWAKSMVQYYICLQKEPGLRIMMALLIANLIFQKLSLKSTGNEIEATQR